MMVPHATVVRLTVLPLVALVIAALGGADARAASSPWSEGPKSNARLLAGRAADDQDGGVLAFVQITLEPGWKTYWRAPGDAGGLPPSFDWSKSSNLAAAEVMFPAPQRFVDRSGNTIGYADGLVLPVRVTPKDPASPVGLVVGLHYGICKDVCVPVEAELALDVAPGATEEALPAAALEALAHVPRAQDRLRPGDPAVVRAQAYLAGDDPKITVEARFADGDGASEVFLEAADGQFLPLAERTGAGRDGHLVFEAPLGRDVDLAQLKGKTVTVTLVGALGASFATFSAQ